MPLLRLEATRNGTVELQPDARADPLVAVARPATRVILNECCRSVG